MMFWEDIEPNITPSLQTAVEQAYAAFSTYRLSGTITYCACPVCMTPEVAAELSTLPLKDISAELLAEYTNSAHDNDSEQVEHQFKHFLPRYLDLIAHCDPPSHLGLETCLVRLNGYRSTWGQAEVDAIDVFFDSFLAASIDQLELLEWPAGFSLAFDMGEVLTMVALAGGDLTRVLNVFENAPDPDAAVHMASLRGEVSMRRDTPYYNNAHLDSHPNAAHEIGIWLRRDIVTERILSAHDTLNDADYDRIFNAGV